MNKGSSSNNRSLINLFQYVTGTSTGGIIALYLATGKSLLQCRQLYFKLKEVVFANERPYKSDVLENILKCEFGNLRFKDLVPPRFPTAPRMCITAVRIDNHPAELVLLRNYESLYVQCLESMEDEMIPLLGETEYRSGKKKLEEALENDETDSQLEYVWQVARATSSAPSYFKPHGTYIDGGIYANNPTSKALSEIALLELINREPETSAAATNFAHQPKRARINLGSTLQSSATTLANVNELWPKYSHTDLVLSVGCGSNASERVGKKVASCIQNVGSPSDFARLLLNATGVKALFELLVARATERDGSDVTEASAWCLSKGAAYVRLTPPLADKLELDAVDTRALIRALCDTECYLYRNKELIHEICNLLKN